MMPPDAGSPKAAAILREPLVHFLAIGAVLFAARELWPADASAAERGERIEVAAARVEWLRDNWQARWLRPPTEAELRGLVDAHVRQEVLYRQALVLGLDREDPVVRQRMVQKLEFLTEDLASQVQPSEAELRAFFAERLDAYRIPERRSFTQIYLDADRRGAAVLEAAEELLAQLRAAADAPIKLAQLGDRIMLEPEHRALSPSEVEGLFGQRFAGALFELEPGEWHGPVVSGYGLHLVRVGAVEAARVPELEAVRDVVLRDYATAVRNRASEAMYESLAGQYEIRVDEAAIRELALESLRAEEGR